MPSAEGKTSCGWPNSTAATAAFFLRRSSAIALQSVPQWSRAQLATPPRRATVVKPSADTEPPSLSLLCESSSVATVGRG
uniref:Uncharacterized protein n=1 Tax=Oryza nivara TaxID=4536 RepID=A0A0E0GP84_ORYNI